MKITLLLGKWLLRVKVPTSVDVCDVFDAAKSAAREEGIGTVSCRQAVESERTFQRGDIGGLGRVKRIRRMKRSGRNGGLSSDA